MNILYDHQIFGIQRYGGISRYFIELAQRIVKMGHSVQIRAPLYVTGYPFGTLNPKGLRIPVKLLTDEIMHTTNNLLSSLLGQNGIATDIYHDTYYVRRVIAPQYTARVVTVHDMIHEKFPNVFSQSDPTTDYKRNAVTNADHIICISENTKKDLIDYFKVNEDKISVVYHGLPQLNPTMRSEGADVTSKPYFLFVGSRRKYKNFDRFVKAFACSKKISRYFDVVCFGGERLVRQDKNLVHSNHLSRQFHFIHGKDTTLAHLYTKAFALIYPSLYEGFGFPPLEAMAFGCPVLCSDTSSLPEITGDAALHFNPYSVESMVQSMENIVDHSHLRDQLIHRGLKRVRSFSWDLCAQNTLGVYKKLLS